MAALTVPLLFPIWMPAQGPLRGTMALLPDAPSPVIELPEQSSSSSQQPQNPETPKPLPTADGQQPLTPEEKRKESEAQLQKQLHQRMAGVVPNFNAVLDGHALPLSAGEKMYAAFRSAVDPYQFGWAFFTSAIGQAAASHSTIDPDFAHHGYPAGWKGFGMRYGANYLDQFNGTIIGNGILPVLLHQDPRYYRMGTGSFKRRFFYSLSTTVVCHSDTGKLQPNYSNVLGNLISGGLSNFYYPKAEHGALLTIEQGMEVTGEGSFGALLIEFYPDIRKHIHKKKPAEPTVGNPAP